MYKLVDVFGIIRAEGFAGFLRLFLVFAPPGSRRERWILLAIRSYGIVRDEGLGEYLRRLKSKLIVGPSVKAEDLQKFRPDASIVIPVFNASDLTKNCLEKLYTARSSMTFEVLVIDNHSKDGTQSLLRREVEERPHLRSWRMPRNLGFAGAVNYGCRQASGKYVIILNNDTLVSDGWLDRLTEPFLQDELIGIVSPVTNYVGEGPQIDPDAVQIDPADIDSYAERIKERAFVYEPGRLVFFCAALRKQVLDLVGDLDIGYERGNFEDDDYCMRAIAAGFRLAIARGSFVYHFGTMTFKKNRISHTNYMEINRKRFYRKAQNISVTLRPPKPRSNEITLSVIVRTLDRPELLRKALISLSNQTFRDFEAIVINDGGADLTRLLGDFEPRFSITYVQNSASTGRTEALNTGVKHSLGKWIAFLDDDDILYPWHLDSLISAGRQNPDKFFFYSDYNRSLFLSRSDDFPLATAGTPPWEFDRRKLLVQNYIPIHTWLLSRRCFEESGGFNREMDMLEDFEFLLRLSRGLDFHHVKRVTCEYRYYLDGINSMTTRREKVWDAQKGIYDNNPVEDADLQAQREILLNALNEQIQKIKQIQKKLESNPGQEKELYLEIVNLITQI